MGEYGVLPHQTSNEEWSDWTTDDDIAYLTGTYRP